MAYGIIYKITCKINGKSYVGKTTRTLEIRFKEHVKADSYIGKAIRKYGAENFSREVIEECETPEQLNEREIFWIAKLNTKQPNGYNRTDGGDGSNTFLGKHHTEKTKAILRAKNLGKRRGEDSYWFGKKIPAKFCVKMADSKRAETPYQNLLEVIVNYPLSYGKLAQLMGSSQASISMKMRDLRPFSENDVAKFVEIFGLPAEYLMARDDGQPLVLASRAGENNPFFGKQHTDETRMASAMNNRGETPYKNLLAEMDKRQISYSELATMLEISQANISRKMTNVRNFTAKDIAKLVEIFELPEEYLMERADGLEVKTSNRGKTPYKNLLKEINNRKLTYTALGELMGLSHQSVSEKMHCKKNFTAENIAKLVEIFGLPAEYLMARED